MRQPNPTKPSPDEWLADFTDRVLSGDTSLSASRADPELSTLEKTVLRLKRSLPQEALDEKLLKRMQADFKIRARKASPSTASVWQILRPRQRLTLAFVGLALAVILIASPFLPLINDSMQGTAGLQPRDIILLGGIVCVVLLLLWVKRRR